MVVLMDSRVVGWKLSKSSVVEKSLWFDKIAVVFNSVPINCFEAIKLSQTFDFTIAKILLFDETHGWWISFFLLVTCNCHWIESDWNCLKTAICMTIHGSVYFCSAGRLNEKNWTHSTIHMFEVDGGILPTVLLYTGNRETPPLSEYTD